MTKGEYVTLVLLLLPAFSVGWLCGWLWANRAPRSEVALTPFRALDEALFDEATRSAAAGGGARAAIQAVPPTERPDGLHRDGGSAGDGIRRRQFRADLPMTQSRRATRPRVVIAASAPAVRAGMRLALAASADCSEADGPAGAIDAVARRRHDVCFIDADHGGTGIHTLELIRRVQPDARVVLVTEKVSEEEFLQAVRAGAAGYLPQSLDPKRLPHIVYGVLHGEAAIPRSLIGRLCEEVRNVGRRSISVGTREVSLTQREAQVLDMLGANMPTSAIARRLGIANVTVRRHRATLYAKLGVRSRAELQALDWPSGS